jgi:hypothetical protein
MDLVVRELADIQNEMRTFPTHPTISLEFVEEICKGLRVHLGRISHELIRGEDSTTSPGIQRHGIKKNSPAAATHAHQVSH